MVVQLVLIFDGLLIVILILILLIIVLCTILEGLTVKFRKKWSNF